MRPEVRTQFLANTDETGRFIVTSQRTGKTYFVEPIVGAKTPEWGSVDPATGKLMHKKGDGKYTGGITAKESLITEENGASRTSRCWTSAARRSTRSRSVTPSIRQSEAAGADPPESAPP